MSLTEMQIKERVEYLDKLSITECSDGKKYVFISYASDDWEKVFKDVVVPFQEQYGLRVYTDKAFDKEGSAWVTPMLRNIRAAEIVITFVSQSYTESYACFLEMLTAVTSERKIIFVELEKKRKSAKTTDILKLEPSVINEFNYQSKFLIEKVNQTELERSMCSAANSFATILRGTSLSKYDITYAFECFWRASINWKSINNLKAIRETIQNLSTEVFEETSPVQPSHKSVPKQPALSVVVKEETKEVSEPKTSKAVQFDSGKSPVSYTLFGKKFSAKNQANLMYDIFEKILRKYPEKYSDALNIGCISDTDFSKVIIHKSGFNACRTFILDNGKICCIGSSYSMKDKLRYIAQLLLVCGIDRSELIIDGYELPDKFNKPNGEDIKKTNHGSNIHYFLYENEYIENQTDMMFRVFDETIKRHPEKREQIVQMQCVSETNYRLPENKADKPYFRTCRWSVQNGVCIGTSYDLGSKFSHIKKLLTICGESIDTTFKIYE